MGTSTSTSGISPEVAALTTDVAELKDMMKTLILDKQKSQVPATVKAVEKKCVTCGGAHSYRNYPTTDDNVYHDNIQEYVSQAATTNFNQGDTGYRPQFMKMNTASSSGTGSLLSNSVTNPKEDLNDITTRSGVAYQRPTIPTTSSYPSVKPSAPMPNPKPSIPYPSRRNDERRREKANDQIEKFYEIFKDLS
ncbi:hypothetical protein Tco_1184579, partial [Tanacetum coccineum]